MTKQEFVDAVADKAGLTKRDAGEAVDAVLEVIHRSLRRATQITFTGFGKFTTSARRPPGCEPADRREGADRGGDRAEVLGRLAAQEGRQLAGWLPALFARGHPGVHGAIVIEHMFVYDKVMQLSFDAADRLVELVQARRGPVPATRRRGRSSRSRTRPRRSRARCSRTSSRPRRDSRGAERRSGSRPARAATC